jgi:hypothetical protein
MAKFKPAGKTPAKASTKGLIPCLLLVAGGIALISIFFYYSLKAGA